MSISTVQNLIDQVEKERKLVSFDSYDLSVRQLMEMFQSNELFVPPEYQRQFVWGADRESELVESVMLGIPVPNLFMATNKDATWEVVDGVQRLSSIAHFIGTNVLLQNVKRENPLKITGLRKLSGMNGMTFNELPKTMQLQFMTRPLRLTVLNDKSDLDVRFDLFERLNTGGISLTNQEIRNCVFRGPFNDDLRELADDTNFKKSIHLKPQDKENGMREELILRFFAFLENYSEFDHSVKGFLNEFMKSKSKDSLSASSKKLFKTTFILLHENLPKGIVRGERLITPINLFEAISVGLALAAMQNKGKFTPAKLKKLPKLLNDESLRKWTTGATNSKKSVTGRINYVRDALI